MKKKLHKENQLHPFIILWGSQSISELGSSMTSFALVLWAYGQKGTAMSTVSMAFFTYLPYVLVSLFAGTLADRWKKKHIMFVCDTIAAMGSMAIFVLLLSGQLAMWHLYGINLVIGAMNAFQQPASMVAVTLLTPRKHYSNVSGMQAFSNALVAILQPVLATFVMSLGGLTAVLVIDLATFIVAFVTLAFFIRIPEVSGSTSGQKSGFFKQTADGIRYLRKQRAIWRMILFFALVNLLSSMAGNALMPAMILSRTGNDQRTLSIVSACLGIGTMAGGLWATFARPVKSRRRAIFLSCGLSFLFCDCLWGFGRTWPIWAFAALIGNFPIPILNAGMTSVMRERIPVEWQGRVFSTQAAFQFFTIPLGYLLGGVLADYVFEPFMLRTSYWQNMLEMLVGSGKGSGIALIFLLTGMIGFIISIAALKNPVYRELDS